MIYPFKDWTSRWLHFLRLTEAWAALSNPLVCLFLEHPAVYLPPPLSPTLWAELISRAVAFPA